MRVTVSGTTMVGGGVRFFIMTASIAALEAGTAPSRRLATMIEAPVFASVGAGLSKVWDSSVALYKNQRECFALRKQQKERPETITFDLHHKLNMAGTDISKVLSLTWLSLYARWYTPVTVYFFPDMLPSTFETDKMRTQKRDEVALRRRSALFEAVARDETLGSTASAALAAPSKAKALETIAAVAGDREFKELPNPVFYATSRAFDGPFRIFPKPLHVRAIRQGIKRLAIGDEALRRSNVADLPPALLELACHERGISACSSKADMVYHLKDWLTLTHRQDTAADEIPNGRVLAENNRLALIALNTASTLRKKEPAFVALYSRNSF